MSERDMSRVGAEAKPGPSPGPQLMNNNSKSVPTLHNIGKKEGYTTAQINGLKHSNLFQATAQTNREASTIFPAQAIALATSTQQRIKGFIKTSASTVSRIRVNRTSEKS